jgi:hypothetical protein
METFAVPLNNHWIVLGGYGMTQSGIGGLGRGVVGWGAQQWGCVTIQVEAYALIHPRLNPYLCAVDHAPEATMISAPPPPNQLTIIILIHDRVAGVKLGRSNVTAWGWVRRRLSVSAP